MNARLNGMTVAELIENLQQQDPEAQVVFASDYGDHCHTMQVSAVEDINTARVVESGYSNSGYALDSERFPTESPTAFSEQTFVILK